MNRQMSGSLGPATFVRPIGIGAGFIHESEVRDDLFSELEQISNCFWEFVVEISEKNWSGIRWNIENIEPIMSCLIRIVQVMAILHHLCAYDVISCESFFDGLTLYARKVPVIVQNVHGIGLCVLSECALQLVNDDLHSSQGFGGLSF